MAYDLIPRSFLSPSFPSSLSSFWNDEDDLMSFSSLANGLSLSEDDKKVYVEASLPGIDPENIDVTYQEGYVWIRGEKQNSEEGKDRKYYKQASSSFSYRIAVPAEINESAEPEANYKNGVMTVTFEKAAKTQPKKISVKY